MEPTKAICLEDIDCAIRPAEPSRAFISSMAFLFPSTKSLRGAFTIAVTEHNYTVYVLDAGGSGTSVASKINWPTHGLSCKGATQKTTGFDARRLLCPLRREEQRRMLSLLVAMLGRLNIGDAHDSAGLWQSS
jgi:hypothetical protein